MIDPNVFKERPDGSLELVGDFERLYQTNPDPWGQSGSDEAMTRYYNWSRDRLVAALAPLVYRLDGANVVKGLEVGCGLGHVTALLNRRLRYCSDWVGIDISPRAIAKARLLYPHGVFGVADILGKESLVPFNSSTPFYGVVLLNQILWYIIHDFDTALFHARCLCKSHGLIVFSQAFLKGEQRYGKKSVDGFAGLVRTLLDREKELGMQLIRADFEEDHTMVHNDGIVVLRKL
jgi:SAM-dependent methyltransferase